MRKITLLLVLVLTVSLATVSSGSAVTAAQAQTDAQSVILQKIQEYGLDQFTDGEMAEINKAVDEAYDRSLATVRTNHFSHTELTGDALQQAMEAKLAELGYVTREQLLQSAKQSKAEEKLRAMVVKDVTVSDDEIQSWYDAAVLSETEAYSLNLAQYQADVENGSIICYIPAGYRYIKNLLVYLSDDMQAAIKNQNRAITARQTTLDATLAALGKLSSNPTDDTQDEQKNREELTALSQTLQAEIDQLKTSLKTFTENAFGALQPRVDALMAKIDTGADFDALIETDGEDPDALIEPVKTTGYLVCAVSTMWVPEFTEYGMALAKVGDISVPFRTRYGIHIVQYASDLTSGKVPLAEVYDRIRADLLTAKQDAVYNAQIEQWIANAKAETLLQ
ncbi:MAG TPA: peptidylprolyl isomerase [Candidatus Limiplasma sp.]|nr:peptidylprolyl isomerase [Candidatus Limiplasma sp.]HPS80492.1 peptidylprolyl isomerase [Candidatus Limiplasma sp.]